MAEDLREDSGEFYPGGTVVPGLPTVVPNVPVAPGGSSVEVVAPSGDGAGKAADAKATHEALHELEEKIKSSGGGGGVAELMIETTYANLVALRNNGGLIPGMQYRIADYVATTVQEHTQSANHPFDIIVTANNVNELNEVARAIRHKGDTYFPNTTKFEAWQIWYSLDNDTNRFEWADANNGKGVIYRMIDEFNNDVPYDFKGIKMQACIGYDEYREVIYSEDYRYTFGVSKDDSVQLSVILDEVHGSYSNKIKPYYHDIYDDNWILLSVKLSINFITFGSGCYNNTFGSDCYDNTFGSHCASNTFDSDCYNNTFASDCYNNTFGSDCYNNTFGSDCYNNTFGSDCYNNTFGSYCSNNTFDSDCADNTFDSYCYNNTFGSSCYNNTFGSDCYNNTFDSDCSDNTFDSDCYNNTFGSYCYDNTFASYCYDNTFGSYCYSNIFASYCYDNTFGSDCYDNRLPDFFTAIILQNSVSENTIACTKDRGDYEYCKNIEIKAGVIYEEINIDDVEQSYHTEIRPVNSITITV